MSFYFTAVAQQLNDAHFQYPKHQAAPRKAHPASARLLNSLKSVKITEEDLKGSKARQCAICLGDHMVENVACKLACGHVFHEDCVHSWLDKNNTCPNCRFELETATQK